MKNVFFLSALVLIICACSESKDEALDQSDLVIKTGTICGWCAQNDTLTIAGNDVRYVNFIQCSTTNPSVSKTGRLETTTLDLLLSKLDYSEFKKLDLNSCNVCFDGCDDWISIKNGVETHTIRFSRNDPKLQSIKSFVDQLNQLKSQYSSGK